MGTSRNLRTGPITAAVSDGESLMERPRVLVVEDDPSISLMVSTTLRREGHRVACAGNGKEGIDAMLDGDVDLVVLDLMMPVMTGWEVLDIRAANPTLQRIPVIVVTACFAPQTASVLDKGICALLPKPFDLGALKAVVSKCLDHPHGPPLAASV